jgi:hypothetical protein
MKQATGILAVVLGVLLWLAASAHAQCSTVCSNYIQGECSEHTTTCAAPAPPKPAYGAIAYGRKSGAWGSSDHWGSEAKAESVAMSNCKKNGDDCEVMVWYERKCGAVASAKGDAAYWGLGDGEGAANENALASCEKDGGKDCKIEVAECSR